jgi:4-hydroxy-tetrahydrodipicolinate synthase
MCSKVDTRGVLGCLQILAAPETLPRNAERLHDIADYARRTQVNNGDRHIYEGVYAAMATPLTAEREIDHDGVKKVVDHFIASGINGLSILGTTGECNGLRREQRYELLDAVLEANDGRGVIFTGAAGTVASDIIEDLKRMEKPGISGALVPPPFYYNLDTQGVIEFYEHLADESPFPIILYNIPQATKVPLAIEAVERLAKHRNIMGIKDSSGNVAGFVHYARVGAENPGFTVLTGADGALFACLMVGGHGIIGGTVNAAPALEAKLFKAFKDGNHQTAVELQRKLTKVVDICKSGPAPAGYKAALVLQGLCGGYMTHPLQWLSNEQMQKLRAGLAELGMI